MTYQTETARPVQRASGGTVGHIEYSLQHTSPAPNLQTVGIALAEIDAARKAARTAGTTKRRAHFRRVADNLSNHLADNVLRFRVQGPQRPGRRVPPTSADLRLVVDRLREIEEARTECKRCEAALQAALDSDDPNVWCGWERRLSELDTARRRLSGLEQETFLNA